MKNGGVLHREIKLNIPGHNSFIENVTYHHTNDSSIPLVVIDLKPKLIELKKIIAKLVKLIEEKEKYVKTNPELFIKNSKKLKRFYKATPSFFTRISENNSRLFYEGTIKLKKLKNIIDKKKRYYTIIEIILISLTISFILILVRLITKQIYNINLELQNKEAEIRTILDSQPNIIIITDGHNIKDANNTLLKFFNNYTSIDEFIKKHNCICNFFILPEGEEYKDYITNKMYNGKNWIEYILANPNKVHRVAMKKGEDIHHFIIVAQKKEIINHKKIVIYSFIDITIEVKNKEQLSILNHHLEDLVEEKTKELKDINENLEQSIIEEVKKSTEIQERLLKSEKLASMGDMIGNIAHQWRQPLSVISTAVTGMKVQKEFGVLDDEEFNKNCDTINNTAQYLSKTIDDFRNFIKGDRDKSIFILEDEIKSFTHIIESSLKIHNINIIFELQKGIKINGYENELTQCLINIFNNAKDAIIEYIKDERYIFISTQQIDNKIIIKLKDNAHGIPNDVIPHIFEPYFTTKHKSQGTGLGLHMTYNLIVDGMGGTIEAHNVTYKYKNNTYTGAEFTITLNSDI